MGAPVALMVTRALVVRLFATLAVWAVAVLAVLTPAAAIKNGQAITKAPAWAAYVTTVSRFLHALSTGDFANYSCHLSNLLRLTRSRSYRLQRSCTTAPDWCLHRASVSEIQKR